MYKSLFARYFMTCVSVILISITVLGAFFLVVSSQYFKSSKYDLLLTSVTNASAITVSDFESNNEQHLNSRVLMSGYTILARAIDAEIFLTDVSGNTLLCTEASPCAHTTYTIPQSILEQTLDGGYKELGTLSGIYKRQYYTVGVPVQLTNGTIIGYLFSSANSDELLSFLGEMLGIFGISALLVLALAFVALYFISRQMVRPLIEMAAAAKSFGNGDFSKRIAVNTYDEVGQLALALNSMADSLSVLESTRRSFVANVSHELKTPMTTIAGFIDGILDGTIPPEKRDHYLQIVSGEVKRLSRLVRSMLDIARIEAGEMPLKPSVFDVNDTVCRTIFTFEQSIEAKHLEVRGLDAPKMMVEADPDLIHQVIYNLVDNAVKFVNDGGYLEINYTVENGWVYVGIKNSGQGIPKEEISKVFERFYKSDRSRSLDKNGVGLGLYIVQSIVNLHGGNIMVRSTEGEFCEFVFSLPQAKVRKNSSKTNK